MGFNTKKTNEIDETINTENKVRITLSERAQTIMSEDMYVFNVKSASTFINTVFTNFREEAKSSISIYIHKRKETLEKLLESALDEKSMKIAINKITSAEEKELVEEKNNSLAIRGKSKLYHINKDNVAYLFSDACNEDKYYTPKNTKNDASYGRLGHYIRAVVEEYCALPFIERERIYKKEIYEIIENACKNKKLLAIEAPYKKAVRTFYVYPYKILSDPFHTQSYLVCYSREKDDSASQKKPASFSMARINMPRKTNTSFSLSKAEIANLENEITKRTPAYLIGQTELIKVQLTDEGKRAYKTRIYSRPVKNELESTDEVYAFNCTPKQISNYFFSFDSEAKILEPIKLREEFKKRFSAAAKLYEEDV